MRLWCQGALMAFLLVSVAGASASAQSALEGLAASRISQETGIPSEFVRALFVDEPDAEFILAFIYINEQAVDSNLRPEIKTAITPYVNRNAILVLVVPARQSFFDPLDISLVQTVFRVSLSPDMLVPITGDLRAPGPASVLSGRSGRVLPAGIEPVAAAHRRPRRHVGGGPGERRRPHAGCGGAGRPAV